jgi:soluble lytic murein transglycosylase-like protein
MFTFLDLSVFAVLLTASAFGADSVSGGSGTPAGYGPEACHVAVLRNGFTIQYVRHEVAGPATRLWLCAGAGAGYVEIPGGQIEGFEQEQSAVPLTPALPARVPETTASGILPVKDPIKDLIASAASRYQIDPDFVDSVVKAESGFNPTAVSPAGARGLMQLMPRTAAWLGVENVFDPAANVEGGTKYLRQLLDQYDGDAVKVLAAYNAGPRRVEQYGGIPPYRETRAYVARIIDDYNRKKLQQQAHSTAASADK